MIQAPVLGSRATLVIVILGMPALIVQASLMSSSSSLRYFSSELIVIKAMMKKIPS